MSKSKKDAAAATEEKLKAAFAMDEAQRVDELSKALLREYMHRKGYKKTLAKFDEESPRDLGTTISSRAVMNETMNLGIMTHRNKVAGEQGTHPAFGTIMELVCSHRLRKRALHPKGSAPPDTTEFVPRNDCDLYDSSDEEKTASSLLQARKTSIKEQEQAYLKQKEEFEALKAARLLNQQAKRSDGEESEKKPKKDKADKKKDKKSKEDKKAAKKENPLSGDDEEEHSKKAKKGGKDKKDKKNKEADTKVAFGRNFDPLAKASSGSKSESGSGSASLLMGETTSSSGKSSGWGIPGGLSGIPSVGLGGGGSSAPVSSAPPSFMAGEGMSLAGNRQNEPAVTSSWEAPSSSAWGSGPKAKPAGGSAAEAMFGSSPNKDADSGFIDDTYSSIQVSPDHFKKQYNPNAKATGVIGHHVSSSKPGGSSPTVKKEGTPFGVSRENGAGSPNPSPSDAPRRLSGGFKEGSPSGFTSKPNPTSGDNDAEGGRRKRVKISFAEDP